MRPMDTLPTDYARFIHQSRYARWIESEGRRETWPETVKRYFDYMERHLKGNNGYILKPELRRELEMAVINLEVMPSMRALMTAGPALDWNNVCAYNCSYLPVDHPWAFDEAMYVLMNGTGVGYSVESRYVDQLPMVPRKIVQSDDVIVVEDSKEGWCYGLRALIEGLYEGRQRPWNLSYVRPAGARLKTFGGRASGPEPLNKLFEFTVKLFNAARGRKLRTIEAHDLMCKIAEIVVVGGVRRSAMISLSDLDDKRMQVAKSGQWWDIHPERALANNSYVLEGRPDMSTFLGEMKALYDSHSGERGIFSRAAAIKQALKYGRRDPNFEFGTNPCVTGDTLILTDQGYVEIGSVVGKEVRVWNGETWSNVTPFSTGENPLVTVYLSDGTSLTCTPYHEFILAGGIRVQAEELKPGERLEKFSMPVVQGGEDYPVDAYSQGFYSGDGTAEAKQSLLYAPKYGAADRLCGVIREDGAGLRGRKVWKHGPMFEKSFVPINGTLEYRLNWLAGLLDADGTVTRAPNGACIQLASIDEVFLKNVRLMLTTLGVQAKVTLGNTGGVMPMPDGRGGTADYQCRPVWRLLIPSMDVYSLVQLGLKTSRLQIPATKPQRDARRFVTVEKVEYEDFYEETFCFTEPLAHRGTFNGIVTGQCSEIILRPYQFCNLTEVVVRSNDTPLTLSRKVRYATILGTFQATLTNFRYLRPVWKQNTEEERLLGVSLTGIMDCNLTNGRTKGLPGLLTVLRQVAVDTNETYARALGIRRSAAITCVKPSGTVSQLVDAASGIHPRYAPFYIRTVRADNKDPLTQFLRDQGVPAEPCVTFPDSVTVFSFPVKSPYGALTRNDLSAIEHLNLWLTYQRFWCEHKPSVTIYYGVDEFPEVQSWVWKHLDEVSGISFLPRDDHVYKQAPYQPVSEKEFLAAQARSPARIEWERLREYETEDTTTGTQELACSASGEGCELVDIG